MDLIVNFYNHSRLERSKELNYALKKNLESKLFDRIICFMTHDTQFPMDVDDLNDEDTIQFVQTFYKPTYKEMIEDCQERYGDRICVLSNLDIFFDDTLKLVNNINFDKNIVCLSRWEFNPKDNSSKRRSDEICSFSQDSWIFKSNQKFSNIEEMHFTMGVPSCDGRISYLFKQNNLIPINPCLSIKSYHVHETGIRSYVCGRDKIKGEVLYVPPISLKDAK